MRHDLTTMRSLNRVNEMNEWKTDNKIRNVYIVSLNSTGYSGGRLTDEDQQTV